MGQWLSERLGQQFVIENRTGAAGTIAAEAVVRAPPDGHTLLIVSTGVVSAALYNKLNYNFIRDIAPVAGIIRTTYVMVVNLSVPAKTIPEFIAYAKANPGKISMASAGTGSGTHLTGELFKMMTGINMLHVAYRGGGPALIDLLAGQVQILFDPVPNLIEYIKAGKVRPLAVTTATRVEVLPGVPALSEFLPNYEATSWFGIDAPKNTPAEIIETLNKEINAGLADPKLKARLTDLGGTVLPGSPADFGKLIADDTEKWAKVIRAADIKPE
jgi:tripartite-type tricarboxylate transporter receptor subunit TctC